MDHADDFLNDSFITWHFKSAFFVENMDFMLNFPIFIVYKSHKYGNLFKNM